MRVCIVCCSRHCNTVLHAFATRRKRAAALQTDVRRERKGGLTLDYPVPPLRTGRGLLLFSGKLRS
jgi:hypothetical protein